VTGVGLGFALASFMLVPQALAAKFLNLEICFGPTAQRLRPSANTLFATGFEEWTLNTFFSLALLATFVVIVSAYALLPSAGKRGAVERGILAAALCCVLVTLGPAGAVWDALPLLSNLQFPWRITAVLTLLAAAMVSSLELRRAWLVAALAAVLSIPFASWDRTVPRSVFSVPEPSDPEAGSVFPDPHTAWEAGSGGWYWRHHNLVELCLVPRSMRPFFFDEFRGVPSPHLEPFRHQPAAMIGDPATTIEVVEWGQTARGIEVESDHGGTLVWRVLWFPGMVMAVDGVPVEAFEDRTTGLTAHRLPAGSHNVRWSWHPFPALRAARGISLASLVVVVALGGWAVVGWRRRYESANRSESR
jgi:hypothetical protein